MKNRTKRNLLIMSSALLLIACSKENYWNETAKNEFVEGCTTSMNQQITVTGKDPLKQFNISVDEMCSCQLSSIMKDFPEGPEKDPMALVKSIPIAIKSCIADLKS